MDIIDWQAGDQSLQVNGLTLECSCIGPSPADAPTIVLLHEGLGCKALWRSFPHQLSTLTECGVFNYSRAGYGASDAVNLPRPLDYMSKEAIQNLPVILNAIGARKVILLGHSDGASIASIYAGSVVDHRIRGLILLAPHFFTEQITLSAIETAKKAFENDDLRVKLSRYHKHVDVAFKGWNDAWLHPEFVHWDIGENIDYIRVPVLAIQGVQDQYGSIAHIETLEERCYAPVERVLLDNCEHSPHLEQADAVLASVNEFLRRLLHMESERLYGEPNLQ